MLGARKMQVNETGQQMGVDQLAARTVRDSGRVVGKPEVIHVEPISNDKSACRTQFPDCSWVTSKPAVILRGKPLKLIWEEGANPGSCARI